MKFNIIKVYDLKIIIVRNIFKIVISKMNFYKICYYKLIIIKYIHILIFRMKFDLNYKIKNWLNSVYFSIFLRIY